MPNLPENIPLHISWDARGQNVLKIAKNIASIVFSGMLEIKMCPKLGKIN